MVINIKIQNRVAEYVPDEGTPVCGNAGDTVRFSFDGEWPADAPKTARFIWGGNKFHEVTLDGNECPMPTFLNTDRVLIGVYTEGEDALSSTKAELPLLASIRCGGAHPDAMSAEHYTHEAKEAAKEAAASTAQAKTHADSAATQAAVARSSAALAFDYSERAEAVVYDLENRNYAGRMEEYNWRIALLENHLGFDSPITIIKDRTDEVEIPENSKQYAKIITLECAKVCNAWSDGWYTQGTRAIAVVAEDGYLLRRYEIPVSQLPDYGEGSDIPIGSPYHNSEHHNYIAFKNGKAYYHHNVYSVPRENYDVAYNKRNEDDEEIESCAFQVLLKLAAPEVTDISDIFSFDGFLDVTDGKKVLFEQLITEASDEYTSGCIYDLYPSNVHVIFESAQ